MKTHVNIFEITECEPLLEWGKELMGPRREEALISLRHEGVVMEGMYYFTIEGRHFIVGLMTGRSAKVADTAEEINSEHTEVFKRVKKNKIPVELIYSLDLDSE